MPEKKTAGSETLERRVRRLEQQVSRLDTRLERAEKAVKRLEKYAGENYRWARGMKRWGDHVQECCEQVITKLELRQFALGDQPPTPPKWPPA